ncbi:D12 class N6 adenine-specific DNA methyltransferase [Janthinobacterium sp. MP5059B]|uniref:DNA adenine methylase n=1 Tax=Janthinobacterium sp. MP5059B TaxID=1766683 RepID=UPI0008740D08|nr:DNA adenine methylase [Janthinobacterium sp. MP5059B]OEZ49278.1 D12 class N6 adenine-specific DNA methyltransferase [Janthinobacterium sp. MP5059B]
MKYPGGKGKCYQQIINLMPPHEIYIESHLGGGAVLRNKKLAARNIGIELDKKVVAAWQTQLPETYELVHADALTYLRTFPFSGRELIYADPPYIPSSRRRARVYTCDYVEEDHVALLDLLTSLPCMVMISGYDNPLYAARLATWRKESFAVMTHTGMATESVWMNFPAATTLHDTTHLGKSFRERQTIKRRNERLREKIAQMPAVERTELLRWINSTYANPREVQ